jgi:phosphoribosylformylglycinamidine synthase
LFQNKALLLEAQILCLPGGFSYGDDIAAGRIFARQLTDHLGDALLQFRDRGGLILGICNGFQVLLQIPDLLQSRDRPSASISLTANSSRKFEARWVDLQVVDGPSIFTRALSHLYLPVAHAEGRLAVADAGVAEHLSTQRRVALRYALGSNGAAAEQTYPANPNGSVDDIAGISDATGQVLGLMPHPERYVDRLHHPRWTRGEGADPGDGLRLFLNAVQYFKDH